MPKNRKSIFVVIFSLLSLVLVSPAKAVEYSNPILHDAVIDHDSMQVTLTWSTVQTSDDDEIDDYAYTTDGKNFTALYGVFNSGSVSESQTLTLTMPSRANAVDQFYAIAKVRDFRISGVSNVIKARISEQPIPVKIAFHSMVGNTIIYKISNYNSNAVANSYIKYKVTQLRVEQGSSIRISLAENSIYITNFKPGEKFSFKTVKYVLNCNGFSPYLWCPYNSKAETKVAWPLPTSPEATK